MLEQKNSWYEMDCEPANPSEFGYVHESELPNVEDVKDYLLGCVEALYQEGDVFKLESCLDELCHQFGVKVDSGEPKLENKKIHNFSQWSLGYQRAKLDQMNNTERNILDYKSYKKEVNHGQ